VESHGHPAKICPGFILISLSMAPSRPSGGAEDVEMDDEVYVNI
jgi:hypothetical protein